MIRPRTFLAFSFSLLGLAACGTSYDSELMANGGAPGPQAPRAAVPKPDVDAEPDAEAPGVCDARVADEPTTLYLSADDSSSMASPVIARAQIRDGSFGGSVSIRGYEFLNYYNVSYGVPADGAVGLSTELARKEDGDLELQIGAYAGPATTRRPVTLTLVLDTSGSMSAGAYGNETSIGLERAAIRAFARTLHAGDVVNAVTWDSGQNVRLEGHVVTGPNDRALMRLADDLQADGATDLHAGLVRGYELAERTYGNDRINRMVLVSDGGANVGVTDAELIGAKANDENREGIYLMGVGVGRGYDDTLMDVVTDRGNGAYVFLDSAQEADAVLGARFDEVVGVAARNVRLQLDMPGYLSMQRFYGEEYSADASKVKPQHLAPGDAMVFQQLLRACDVSRIQDADSITVTARWNDPATRQELSTTTTRTLGEMLAASTQHLARGRAILSYADALSHYQSADAPALLQAVHTAVELADPAHGDPALREIDDLVTRLENARR